MDDKDGHVDSRATQWKNSSGGEGDACIDRIRTGHNESTQEILKGLGDSWGKLGADDPLWAILSEPTKRNGGWEIESFLETGRQEAAALFRLLDGLKIYPNFNRALDFGCGVGRVSHALGIRFRHVDGLDVSSTMIETARRIHAHRSGLAFHLGTSGSLPFETQTFDLVYSRLVLQHMPSEIAIPYVSEFVRTLTPTGVAVFQAPSKCLVAESVGPTEVELESGTARIEMHAHSREDISRAVEQMGGEIAFALDDPCAGEGFESLKYIVRRRPGA